MNYLRNSDALIIDLRQNGGGSPSMIQLISSYLFRAEPIHLNSFYWRPGDRNTQTWTLPYVPGKRMPDTPVYVLTSKNTFSAAEEFSYNLRNLERATLIGETTGGGAHPGGTRIATDRYSIWVPSGRAINPITNDNWEGVGVKPHIEVPADQALAKAHTKALKQLIKKSKDEDSFLYEWALEGLNANQNPVTLSEETMESYVGNYGPRIITMENGSLYYQREGRAKYKLIPMTASKFQIKEIPYFRIQMLSEDGAVVGLEGHYNNGRVDKNRKEMQP
jgi:hypothetical protein